MSTIANPLWELLSERVGQGLSEPLNLKGRMESGGWEWLARFATGHAGGRYPSLTVEAVLNLRSIVGDDASNERGSFQKRFVNTLFKETGAKLTAYEKALISDRLQRVMWETSVRYDVTNKFDWNAGDFADKGSCFFTPHYGRVDRFALEEAGALAIRFYHPEKGHGTGRAWALPTHHLYNQLGTPCLVPGIVFFNIYGHGDNIFQGILKHIFGGPGGAHVQQESLVGNPYDVFHRGYFSPLKSEICQIYINDMGVYVTEAPLSRNWQFRYLALPFPKNVPDGWFDRDDESDDDDDDDEGEF